MQRNNRIKPRISLLNQDLIHRIHDYSLRILSSVGIRVISERAQQLFVRACNPETVEGELVRMPPELVEWALEAAPSSVDVYDQNGSPAFHLPGRARFGIGATDLYFQDPETDEIVPFTRKHMKVSARLGHSLPSFDVISTMGILQDISPDVSDMYSTLEMTANTTKPIIILISNEELFTGVLDLLEHLHGGLAERPFVIPYFNPITPLVMNTGTIDKMWTAIERGLPVIYSNYGMAGATTPIRAAGVLSLLNAELLAGLTLGQLIREGTPMILGSLPACFDMKGKGSFYDPKSYLLDLACAEMMAHYGMPHAGTSGSGQGWRGDLIASGHQWMNHLISCMGKVGLAPFVGDNLGSLVFSPSVVVLANDIIEQARLFTEGFIVDEEALGLEEIARIGPGGNFLSSDTTLRLCREAHYQSPIFEKMNLEEWQEKGSPQAEDLLRNHTLKLMNKAKPPEDYADLVARGEAFIKDYVGRSK